VPDAVVVVASQAVLVPHGHEVLTATTGKEALDLVATARPDLILLDVMMPEMDGYAVCEALRADE
jgi:CheY-like chemotaxis protein